MQNIFLISSPLQALVCYLYLKKNHNIFNNNTTVFFEANHSMPYIEGVKYYSIEDTRIPSSKIFTRNSEIILSHISADCNLWVSDLLWQMNNFLYTVLKKRKILISINYFDEGTITYFNSEQSFKFYFRQFLKSLYLKILYCNYTITPKKLFHLGQDNGKLVALHPKFISRTKNVFELSPDKDDIEEFLIKFVSSDEIENTLDIDSKNSAIILSQPYYRIFDQKYFNILLSKIKSELIIRGIKSLYVKLHPSEKLEDYDRYYKMHGFKRLNISNQIPFEALLTKINNNVAICSVDTSLMFNARKFFFKGKLYSIGLDYVVKKNYWSGNSYVSKKKQLYKDVDCELI